MTTPAPASKPGRPFTLPAPTWSYGQRAALSFLALVIGAGVSRTDITALPLVVGLAVAGVVWVLTGPKRG
jgi:hypothetical protein